MNDADKSARGPDPAFVDRLVKASGITEAQARELITFLGYDWASLVREARLLVGKR